MPGRELRNAGKIWRPGLLWYVKYAPQSLVPGSETKQQKGQMLAESMSVCLSFCVLMYVYLNVGVSICLYLYTLRSYMLLGPVEEWNLIIWYMLVGC